MPLVKRSPRKVIKLSEAADILQVSRATVREMILRQELQLAPVPRRGRTSPLKIICRVRQREGSGVGHFVK
jgi:transposase